MSEYKQGELLKNINFPNDIKQIPQSKLPQLCTELREYILDVLSENPGHLASSLGTIELSVALHYVFNVPDDTLIWDVGHQSYAHKVLTGRKDYFKTIRSFGGISGFPRKDESKYDCFGTGHSSTSISAVLGMAIADNLLNKSSENTHIAVIGDGSMTGGMAFEALNNAGTSDANLLIILNDNGISIDKQVGGLSKYFTRITISAKYNRLKNKIWNMLGGNTLQYSKHKSFVKKVLLATKYVFSGKSTFFEALGIRYFGPINGNDVDDLIKTLKSLKHIKGAKILHIITKKGKGLPQAEKNPTTYHAPGLFNPHTGELRAENRNTQIAPKYQDVFGETMLELAAIDNRIVGITPAMLSGCSLDKMMDVYPERTFDVGIAEQHAVTLAAGFAAKGLIPFCNIYSSFMQRAYDQIIHDVCLQNLHVVFCLDRAGLVGEDGATHHGAFDLAYLRAIPNIIIAAPLNEMELRDMLFTALYTNKPFAIRYPRGRGNNLNWRNEMKILTVGKGCANECSNDAQIAICSLGTIGNNALEAISQLKTENINVDFYNFRFLKPLDTQLIEEVISKHKIVITVEDGVITGGFGSAIAEYVTKVNHNNRIIRMGLPDSFIEHGTVKELQHVCGIDTEGIYNQIRKSLKHKC
ncbi:MAG: 1-deoxy-D-xylulose-5-phosphate synthase [Bacteroidales bacterium]|jgi:1-deoxy-D-xylulose-5-phosphate synthase|nr:1-deoxy-D-xylulose-5-phosphate synthase [Bacteroidales bacterium]